MFDGLSACVDQLLIASFCGEFLPARCLFLIQIVTDGLFRHISLGTLRTMESIHPPQMDVFGGASNARSKTRTNLARPGPKLHNVRRNTFQHIAGLRTDFPGRLGRFQIDGIIVFLLRARGTLPPPPTRLVVSRSGSDARVPSVWVCIWAQRPQSSLFWVSGWFFSGF